METAAIRRCRRELAGTTHLHGVSSHVMFVARGKAGPFRVETEPMPGADGCSRYGSSMHDEGADDRLITSRFVPVHRATQGAD